MDLFLMTCLAYLVGTILGPDFPIYLITLCIIIICFGFSLLEVFKNARRKMTLILFLSVGIFAAHITLPPKTSPHNGDITITGKAIEITYLNNKTRALIYSEFPPWPDNLIVLLPYAADIHTNDVLTIKGAFLPSKDSSMRLSMATKNTRGTIVDGEIVEIIKRGSPGILLRIKRVIEKKILSLHPGDRGGLLVGLLTGSRSSMSHRTTEELRHTGLTHIVAISGANFVLILGIFAILLKGVRAKFKILILAPITVIFWLFVGGGMAVSRAAITVLFTLLAESSGRKNGGIRALIISATFLAIINPLAPRADASYQLSVLATTGVLIAVKILKKQSAGLLEWKTTFITAICTTVATFPVQLGLFGSFPIISPFTNLFALPVIPLAMAAGAAEVLMTDIPIVNVVLNGLTDISTGFILAVARVGSTIPFSTIDLPKIPNWSFGFLLIISFSLISSYLLALPKSECTATLKRQ